MHFFFIGITKLLVNSRRQTRLFIWFAIDDASRFVGTAGNQFESISRTSPLGHILATLRSGGKCFLGATQLPAMIDPAVRALSHNMIVVGGMAGQEHVGVIQKAMSLNDEQTQALTRFQTREAVGFAAGTAYPRPIHGWVPKVDDPVPCDEIQEFPCEIEPWYPLADIPKTTSMELFKDLPENKPSPEKVSSTTSLSPEAQKIIHEALNSPFAGIRIHIKRAQMSVSAFENGKKEACQKGYLVESSAGKSKFLISTEKAFQLFKYPCPFPSGPLEHSFYTGLVEYLLKHDPQMAKVQTNIQIGKQNAASDAAATLKSGIMQAYEVTLNVSNLMANALKYSGTAFAKIIWVCRDDALGQGVKAFFREADLPADLLDRFDYTHVGAMLRHYRILSLY